MLRFAHPLVLLLLIALAAIVVGFVVLRRQRTPQRAARGRLSPTTVVICLAPVLVLFALADPEVGHHSQPPTVLAVDQSASISPQARALERSWIRGVADDNCISPCRLVSFAGASTVSGPTTPPAVTRDSSNTDLQDAIQTAIGLVPRGGRVVVLSDGGQTQGDLTAAAPQARRPRRPDRLGQASRSTAHDAAITAMAVPPAVRRGDHGAVTLTIHSTVAARRCCASAAVAPPPQADRSAAGRRQPAAAALHRQQPGWQSFEATVSLPGDTQPKNNSMWASPMWSRRRGCSSSALARSPLPGLLARGGLRVATTAPAGLPAATAGYRPRGRGRARRRAGDGAQRDPDRRAERRRALRRPRVARPRRAAQLLARPLRELGAAAAAAGGAAWCPATCSGATSRSSSCSTTRGA